MFHDVWNGMDALEAMIEDYTYGDEYRRNALRAEYDNVRIALYDAIPEGLLRSISVTSASAISLVDAREDAEDDAWELIERRYLIEERNDDRVWGRDYIHYSLPRPPAVLADNAATRMRAEAEAREYYDAICRSMGVGRSA